MESSGVVGLPPQKGVFDLVIVVRSEGRLGNQLFQCGAVLKVRRDSERVLYFGFEDLQALFDRVPSPKSLILPKPRFRFLNLLRNSFIGKLFGEIRSEGSQLIRTKSIFPVYFFEAGFCQNPDLVDIDALRILFQSPQENSHKQPQHYREAGKKCFVHIRRGDYLFWPSESESASLPIEWYSEQIRSIRRDFPKIRFLVFSDDQDWIREHSTFLGQVEIFEGNQEEAFREMAECDSGILSASSFSWWAAHFAALKGAHPFIAPLYWVGWRKGKWYPEGIESPLLTYVNVSHNY